MKIAGIIINSNIRLPYLLAKLGVTPMPLLLSTNPEGLSEL
jgi:hypothetical protein